MREQRSPELAVRGAGGRRDAHGLARWFVSAAVTDDDTDRTRAAIDEVFVLLR
ncbi:hypothetical protein [Streptomyces scopuliridis]|uniref:Uncharacterized protein n=1 Tax=Streptomyces scopuliridis RB72 TaxID=1440053 RepID=A0A2T7TBQ8_9ACTN|nr:hypothetical protein [Streptomyces scopuliridis]PVE12548.1 hypothetical protein Y717_32210 [Streptomyces scopuliridis RB72]